MKDAVRGCDLPLLHVEWSLTLCLAVSSLCLLSHSPPVAWLLGAWAYGASDGLRVGARGKGLGRLRLRCVGRVALNVGVPFAFGCRYLVGGPWGP